MALTKVSGDVIQTNVNISGIITATSLVGNVAGNVNSSGVSTFSGGIVVSAGSTAAPSISPPGDGNTGIFFPSPDTVAIGEGGSEVIRVNSSGFVGINTNNPQKLIEVGAANTTSKFQLSPHSVGWDLAATSGNISPHYQTNISLYSGQIGSGTLRWRIDDAGRVTKPYQVYFYARPATGSNYTSGTIPYSDVDYNIGNHYNSSTYTFTAPVAGVYCISFQFFSLVNAAGGADLHVNGVLTMRCGREGTETYYEGYSNSINKYLNVNDTVRVVHFTGTVHINTPYSHFSAYLLG